MSCSHTPKVGRGMCKNCYYREYRKKYPEKHKAAKQKYTTGNPDRVKKAARKAWLRQHGLTPESYDALVTAAGGRCNICGTFDALVIDHNHQTGQVRGLLCAGCNKGLGHLQDSVRVLGAAVQYLIERGSYGVGEP